MRVAALLTAYALFLTGCGAIDVLISAEAEMRSGPIAACEDACRARGADYAAMSRGVCQCLTPLSDPDGGIEQIVGFHAFGVNRGERIVDRNGSVEP